MKLRVNVKHLRAAMLVMAKNDVRFYLCGVYFDTDKTLAATNGHCLFTGMHETEGLEKGVIVNLMAKVPNHGMAEFTFEGDDQDGIVKFYDPVITDKVIGVGLCSRIDGRFPDYKRVSDSEPSKEPITQIGFNADYLGLLEKITRIITSSKFNAVTLQLSSEHGLARAKIHNIENEPAHLFIMPMKV